MLLPRNPLTVAVAATLMLFSTGVAAQPYTVCIDPGHGGNDPGAVGCGLAEADITLSVGLMLDDLMSADPDLVPIMTRKSDVFVSLQGRADYANDNGAHRFASIHNNAFDGKTSGIETYCYTYGSMASFDQRDRIQDEMTGIWPELPDRGGKTAGFTVLKYTSMPATLSELAFIDYCAVDAILLSDPAEQWAAANAHHAAIRESLGLDSVPGPVEQTGILRGIVYEDLGVGAADMSVRIPGAEVKAVDDAGSEVTSVADDPTASWAFSLSPGSYTVTASSQDYFDGSRVCTVVSGQETWCSIGLIPEPEQPPVTTGMLVGVVYEDTGAGMDDMSVRLAGAQVVATGPDAFEASMTASDPDAYWSFEVPPGTFSVTAYHAGYYPSGRTCSVTQDTETWCSIGLQPTTVVPETGFDAWIAPDVATPGDLPLLEDAWKPDLFSAPDISVDPGEVSADTAGVGEPGVDGATMPGTDGSGIIIAADSSQPGTPGTDCSAGRGRPSRGQAVGLLLLMAVVVLLGRRPRGMILFVLLLVAGLPGCDYGAGGGAMRSGGLEVVPGIPIVGAIPLTGASDFTQPVWSPDGGAIAFAGDGFRTLLWISLDGGSPGVLARGRTVGYDPQWFPSGNAIGYRAPGQRQSDVPALAVSLNGVQTDPPRNSTPGRWLRIQGDRVWLRTGNIEKEISPSGDRYCCATMARDGMRIAFQGIGSGVWVHDIGSGRTRHLGTGNHPRFSRDGRRLVWDDCSDDGRRLTGCILRMADLVTDIPRVRSFHGTPPFSRHPSLGPDGRSLAFESGGAIWIAGFDPHQ